MVIPNEVTAGLSIHFRVSFGDYPASEWRSTLYIRSLNSKANIKATKEGNEFVFRATSEETKNWKPGLYSAVIRVEKGTEHYQPVSQRFTVLPDLTAEDIFDPRSDAEKTLEAIQATLTSRATGDQLKLTFNGRSWKKTPLIDLLALESRFKNKVNTERRKQAGKGLFTINKVRLP